MTRTGKDNVLAFDQTKHDALVAAEIAKGITNHRHSGDGCFSRTRDITEMTTYHAVQTFDGQEYVTSQEFASAVAVVEDAALVAKMPPDRKGFYEYAGTLLTPKRLMALNKQYDGFQQAVLAGGWRTALAILGVMLTDGVVVGGLSQAEYDAVQAAWDTYRLRRA